jgi:hypothetical protein
MIAFLRLAVFGLIGMTVAYWLLRIYFHSGAGACSVLHAWRVLLLVCHRRRATLYPRTAPKKRLVLLPPSTVHHEPPVMCHI